MTRTPPDPLMKAAILVASLDAESADALLEHVEPELETRIRNAVMQLDNIDPDQQQHVIQEFVNRRPTPIDDMPTGVELDPSLARKLADEIEQSPDRIQAAEQTATPFASLHDVAPRVLADRLIREHPQTIAIVTAHLPARHAAEMLHHLPDHLQTEVLMRIARFNDPAPEIIHDLESEMESLLEHRDEVPGTTETGVQTVAAILRSSPATERQCWVDRLAAHDASLLQSLTAGAEPTADRNAAGRATHLRHDINQTNPAATPSRTPHSESRAPHKLASPAERPSFADFEQLSDHAIAHVLAAADPKLTLVALAGAPRNLVQRIQKHLAPGQAAALDRQMQHLGPLRLDDVEQAQQQLAELAWELHGPTVDAEIPRHRFMVAV